MIAAISVTAMFVALVVQLKMIRLTHALFPEAPNVSVLWGRPFYGVEFRVWREHWMWLGWTTWEDRRRGW